MQSGMSMATATIAAWASYANFPYTTLHPKTGYPNKPQERCCIIWTQWLCHQSTEKLIWAKSSTRSKHACSKIVISRSLTPLLIPRAPFPCSWSTLQVGNGMGLVGSIRQFVLVKRGVRNLWSHCAYIDDLHADGWVNMCMLKRDPGVNLLIFVVGKLQWRPNELLCLSSGACD
jgi:hypothetical protein